MCRFGYFKRLKLSNMKNILKKYGHYFWVIPLIFSLMGWYEIFFRDNGDYFMTIMISGLTYYFWGVGTGRIIDKDIKPFEKHNEEEE